MNDANDNVRLQRPGPLVVAGLLLGAGLGGFLDAIVFHQLLQWHDMLSARLPPDNLAAAKVNMFWSGVFQTTVWLMTLAGVALLFRAGRRRDVPWDGRLLAGAGLLGWGLFNTVEGVANHHLLGLHHVREDLPNPLPADLAFLAAGLVLAAVGAWLLRRVGSRS